MENEVKVVEAKKQDRQEEQREWIYDAFISYRHIEPDAFIAGNLHKILEAYKPPKNLLKGDGKLHRTRIKKVFRDQEELPLTTNLSETIDYALQNSEFLIVICSPRFSESMWCKKEVETFIKLHGKEKILTVLVDGEPNESFPEQLMYRDIEVVREDGTTEILREPIEPLAANARGATNKERLKNLKTESLRLMAPMFGVAFDDLKQRQREKKFRTTLKIVGGIAAVALAFGVVSTTMALEISKQNEQIMGQNQQIKEQNSQITLQSATIKEQYAQVLLSNAKSTASYAQTRYDAGDCMGAIETAYSVFPHEGNSTPYLQNTQKLLTDALALYDDGTNYLPNRILKATSVITQCKISPEAKYVATLDEARNLCIWEIASGELVAEKYIGDNHFSDNVDIVFRNSDQLYTMIDNKFALYDIPGDMNLYEIETKSAYKLYYEPEQDRIITYNYSAAELRDGATGRLIASNDENMEERTFAYSVQGVSKIISSDQKYYAYATSESFSDEKKHIVVRSMTDGSLVRTYEIPAESVEDFLIVEDSMYVASNFFSGHGADYLNSLQYQTYLYKYDLSSASGEPVWKNTVTGQLANRLVMAGDQSSIGVQYYDRIHLVDMEDGSPLEVIESGDQIAWCGTFDGSPTYVFVTRRGEFISKSPSLNEPLVSNFFEANTSNLNIYAVRNGVMATVPYQSAELTLYMTRENPDRVDLENWEEPEWEKPQTDEEEKAVRERDLLFLEKLGIQEQMVLQCAMEKNGKLYVVTYYDRSFDMFRMDTNGEPMVNTVSHFDSMGLYQIDGLEVSEDGKFVWIDGATSSVILDMGEDTVLTKTPTMEMQTAFIYGGRYVDFENMEVYCKVTGNIFKLPLYSKEDVAERAAQVLGK